MERTLIRKPHEKEKMVVSSTAPIAKKNVIARKSPSLRSNPTSSVRSTKTVKLERTIKSSTSQPFNKKLVQKGSSKRLEAARSKGSSRSVNYLSSTTASRAKAASTAQIHKPTTTASVNKLITNAVMKSDISLKQRRPKSANNNKDLVGAAAAERASSISSRRVEVKGKSRSQATLKSNNGSLGGRKPLAKLQLRDRSLSGHTDKDKDNKHILDRDQNSKLEKYSLRTDLDFDSPSSSTTHPNRLSHSSTRSSGERKGIHHVTMNKTSELRAALHRPLITKRSGTARSETSKSGTGKKIFRPTLTRDSKLKKRVKKRLSTSSPKAPSDSSSFGSTVAKTSMSKEST